MSVTQGQCDAKPTVTFPDTEHHHSLAGTKLYCLLGDSLTEAHVSEHPVRFKFAFNSLSSASATVRCLATTPLHIGKFSKSTVSAAHYRLDFTTNTI